MPALEGRVKTALAGIVGKPLERALLRDALAKVPELGAAADVAVTGEQVAGGIRLVVALVPQPTLTKLVLVQDGTAQPAPVDLIPMTGSPIDPHKLDQAVSHLVDKLHDDGRFDASGSWSRRGTSEVELVVTSGPRYVVDHVEVAGNTVKSDDLIALAHKFFHDGDRYNEDLIDRASLELQSYYWDHGFANSRIEHPAPTGAKAVVVYKITEGPVFKLGAITITGLADKTLAKKLPIKTGDIFNRSKIVAARSAVEDAAKAVGIHDPMVLPLTKVELDKKLIELTFEVSPGHP
jgi:outer membrane protein insertion porin family